MKKRGKKASLRKSHRRSRRRNPGLAGRASRRRGISELQDQLTATANQLKHRPGLSRRIRKMVSAYCSGEAESRLARELQDRLLPTKPPEISGLQIATRLIRSRDGVTALYDIFEIGEGTVGFFIAETSCKGLEAALLLTLTKVALDAARARPLAGKSRPASPTRLLSPGAIMEQINEDLVARKSSDQCLTAFLGLLDTRTCTMRYVNASDKCPIFSGERGLKLLCTRNRVLGRSKDMAFPENEIHLERGDNFLIFSAGIGQAKSRRGRGYSFDRLSGLVAKQARADADRLLDGVASDLEKHLAGGKCPADISLIAVKLTSDLAGELKIVISTDPAQLGGAVNAVMERMKALNYGERSLFAMRLCLEEALINAMKHGNKMDRMRKIIVTCSSDAHQAQISVEDEGPGFHPEAVPDPTRPENLQLAHGRGMLLMRSYMDQVAYNAKGNKVTLVKKAPWQ